MPRLISRNSCVWSSLPLCSMEDCERKCLLITKAHRHWRISTFTDFQFFARLDMYIPSCACFIKLPQIDKQDDSHIKTSIFVNLKISMVRKWFRHVLWAWFFIYYLDMRSFIVCNWTKVDEWKNNNLVGSEEVNYIHYHEVEGMNIGWQQYMTCNIIGLMKTKW